MNDYAVCLLQFFVLFFASVTNNSRRKVHRKLEGLQAMSNSES